MTDRFNLHSALLLIVLVLTVFATTIAQLVPTRVPFALLLDVVPFVSVIAATVIATIRLGREPCPPIRLLGAAYVYFAGALVGALGVAHLVAVVLASIGREQQQFVYSFRLYSLIQLGVLLVAGGLIAALQATRLAAGQRHAWRASLVVFTVILAINLPLVPIQGFAILFSALAAFGLLLLGTIRRHFNL